MRRIIVLAGLLFLFGASVKAQTVIDCSNCSGAAWSHEWHPQFQTCVPNPILGCGQGCNCTMGLMAVITVKSSKASVVAQMDFFGGAFVRDEKGAVIGFRIDRPGPLSRNHVKPGDIAYRINGRKPNRNQFGTRKRPIRRAEATWGDDGKLRLRLYY